MIEPLRRIVRNSPLYGPLRAWRVKSGHRSALAAWERAGRPSPPPHIVKQQALLDHARLFGLKILVETGTYYGDMVDAMKDEFDRVYSIELSPTLFDKARRRFRKVRNVELIQGDSGVEMAALVGRLTEPTLFWLDGHYSGEETAKGAEETPIFEELRKILDAPVAGHVILIDDARLFGTDPAYPTIDDLRAFVSARQPNLALSVQDDSIRITPARP